MNEERLGGPGEDEEDDYPQSNVYKYERVCWGGIFIVIMYIIYEWGRTHNL